MIFEYYYGKQADQFNFIQVPKMLIQDELFSELSLSAKMLYGVLHDRMNLSMKNGWLDEENRVYINYQISDIMKDLNVAKGTAIKYLNELVEFGLVEKKRLGLGRANILYVKSFLVQTEEGGSTASLDKNEPTKPINTQKSNNWTSRSSKTGLQEVQKTDFKKSNNCTSRSSKIKLQEVQDLDPNNTNINNTYKSNKYINNTKNNNTESNKISSYQEGSKPFEITPASGEYIHPAVQKVIKDQMREIKTQNEFDSYMAYIKKAISYDALIDRYPLDKEMIDGMVEIIVETIVSQNDYVVIASNKFSKEIVKSRLCKLNMNHIEYVLESMKNNTTEVRNIKKYLLAALYNAPATIDSYYQSKVNHDFSRRAN